METAAREIENERGPDQRAGDERMMQRALDLAAQGAGLVSPSPLVGCVIVDASGQVAGEGFYVYDRSKHAEIIALEGAGAAARGGTAYVTLEPHSYQGRTPPCTEALIRAGISRVVYAIDDPNPMISGRGGLALREAGVEVTTGVLAGAATRLNDAYLHFHAHHRPFVHLKLACSLDGRIATRPGESQWLTGPSARERVHELRHNADAILIGANTARIDDPQLTDRSGRPRRRPLARVVLDHHLTTPIDSRLVTTASDAPVLIFTSATTAAGESPLAGTGIEIIPASGARIEPLEVLKALGERGLHSVLIEGGPTVAAAFLAAGLVDQVTFFIAPIIIGGDQAPAVIGGQGVSGLAEAANLIDVEVRQHGDDVEITGYVKKN